VRGVADEAVEDREGLLLHDVRVHAILGAEEVRRGVGAESAIMGDVGA
jgi:hypothetical protein